MNINELPEEILVRILSFLPRSDRLESALTCRRWAQTIARARPLLRDIWLVMIEYRIKEARSVFANSQRQYENLRLDEVPLLKFNAAFRKRCGPGLRKLEIIDCQWTPKVFYAILQACSSLESLLIESRRHQLLHELSQLPPGINPARIQESTGNLRHLDLHICVDADMLEHLLILMPNVSSVGLSCIVRISDFLGRLPNMLGPSRNITALGSNNVYIASDGYTGGDSYIGRDACEQLLRISSAGLRTLSYRGEISAPRVLDEFRNCTMLRSLHLLMPHYSNTRLSPDIFRNVPELESLIIRGPFLETPFRREDLMPIFDLRKLRKLELELVLNTPACTPVADEIVGALSQMISLESLTLVDTLGIVDSTRFRILARMPNLRELEIYRLRWDIEHVRILLFDLGKLRTLKICGQSRYWHDPVPLDLYCGLERIISIAKDRQEEQEVSSLEVLKIAEIPLSDASLSSIFANHNRLRIVEIEGLKYLTDAGFLTLFQHEPLLEELSLCRVERIYGTFLEGLGELCRRLRTLRVTQSLSRGPPGVRHALEKLKSRRPRVKWELW